MSTKMTFDFSGKRCLVTGAGKGIGRGCVQELVRAGAFVFALSRTQEDLDSLEDEMKREGKGHLLKTVRVDLTDWNAAHEAVEKSLPIDLLVNNAGSGERRSLVDETSENVDHYFDTNFKSMLSVTQVVVDRMLKDNISGSIVNVSSVAALRGAPAMTYCATKGAMDAATRSLAVELGPKGIRVNCVNPTTVNTRLTEATRSDPERSARIISRIPLRRFAEIEDVVGPILFLLSDASRMLTGTSLPVDGGQVVA